ncbi:MAG: type II secretion system protein [Candidatus Riflebacteria bacterium]
MPATRRFAFTFVELLVAVGLIMIVGTTALRIFRSAGQAQKQYSQQVILQMDSRKAFDSLLDRLREGSGVVRPVLGETLDFIVFKDFLNQIIMVYPEPNNSQAKELNHKVYRLVAYQAAYPGFGSKEKQSVLIDSVKRISFTCLSPSSVQVNATIMNSRGEYQFIANVGMLNGGGLE